MSFFGKKYILKNVGNQTVDSSQLKKKKKKKNIYIYVYIFIYAKYMLQTENLFSFNLIPKYISKCISGARKYIFLGWNI